MAAGGALNLENSSRGEKLFDDGRKLFRHLAEERSGIHREPAAHVLFRDSGHGAVARELIFGDIVITEAVCRIRAGGVRRRVAPADLEQIDNRVIFAVKENIVRVKIAVAQGLAVRQPGEELQKLFPKPGGKALVAR